MKKVFQTILEKNHGNCMQAAVSSLLELDLNEVPNFIEIKDDTWFEKCIETFYVHGYKSTVCFALNRRIHDLDVETIKKILKHDNGINGYFFAVVPSATFGDGTTHAVIIDADLKVVHDPNPNQLALTFKPEDIIEVYVHKDDWYIDIDGEFVIES